MLHRKSLIFWMFAAALFADMTAMGQEEDYCPGFKNPFSFDEGNALFYWSARVGDRTYNSSNQNDTTTGSHIMSTCVNNPDIIGHSNITSSVYNSGPDANITQCGHSFFDANDSRFQIITAATDGIDQFTVGPGSTGISRIPAGYLTSIRLGDMRSTGTAVNLAYPSAATGNNKGSEALFYTMRVSPYNSLLFINFAIVARRFSHTAYDAGEFMIRVVAQNDDGSWPNQPINDSLWYKVSAPTFDNNQMPPGWTSGYGVSGTCSYAYKPWTKVAINLSNYLYRKVRIEMYTSDCIYNFDPIYAYISGDYQAMSINSSGCVDVGSDVIDTLRAPEGLDSYQWYVTTQGYEADILNTSYMETVHFRPVAGVANTSVYMPTLADFVLSEGPNQGNTVGKQTFMCVMTSTLDPVKPITSKVYVNISNNKPDMHIVWEADCDLGVELSDYSFVHGDNAICTDSSRWVIYADALGNTPLDTLWGPNVSYRFPDEGEYLVTLRDMTYGNFCGAMISEVIRAHKTHTAQLGIESRTVCEGLPAVVWCDNDCYLNKQWQIGEFTIGDVDTFAWLPVVGTIPVTLTISDSGDCPASVTDTVRCYSYVDIGIVTADSSVCLGDSVVLDAEGLDKPRWTSVPPDPTLDNWQGQDSAVVSPQVTTTYNVEPFDDMPCVRNVSGITVKVFPYPVLNVEVKPTYVDVFDPTVDFIDRSENSSESLWIFSDGTQSTKPHIQHTFIVEGRDSVGVSLHTCNQLQCCADTSMMLAVKTTAVWFPNAFTPGADNNNTFGVLSAANIVYFEMFIYNRQGNLVFHSTDASQTWNGLNSSGTECMMGTYVYYYRYSLDVNPNNVYDGRGTVTLIR